MIVNTVSSQMMKGLEATEMRYSTNKYYDYHGNDRWIVRKSYLKAGMKRKYTYNQKEIADISGTHAESLKNIIRTRYIEGRRKLIHLALGMP